MPNYIDPNDVKAARVAALNHLARRDHCKAELALKLIRQGFERSVANDTASALEAEKVIDDARYVQNFVAYHADRGEGPARLGRKLKSLEVAPELIKQYLDEGQDWVTLARAVREEKFGPDMPASQTDKVKQAYYLQYR